MSAVPKKKLCWNCEGNVSREVDNCPYCGVYLQATDLEEDSNWNPSYRPSSKTEEIPSPLYRIQLEQENDPQNTLDENVSKEEEEAPNWNLVIRQLKRDVFPVLFLMSGSIFFLFGVVLFLFAQNGTLTLQWRGHHGLYFLLFAFPLIAFGWKYLQQLESND
jgi:hypothetical protein